MYIGQVTEKPDMKKTLLLSLCLTACACFYAHAQVQKSDQNLGFGFDINSLGGDAEETRTNLFFTYTYFISNRLSIGVGPRFGWTKSTNSETLPFLHFSFTSDIMNIQNLTLRYVYGHLAIYK